MKTLHLTKKFVYAPNNYNIAVPTATKNGKITTTTAAAMCRETVAYNITYEFYKPGNEDKYNTRFKIIMFCPTKYPEHLKRAMAVVHSFESSVGIARTVPYKLVVDGAENITGYVFSFSVKWLRSTPMLSMYLLMLRASLREVASFDETKVTDFDSFSDAMLNHKQFKATSLLNKQGGDRSYIRSTIKEWKLVAENMDTLFPSREPRATRFLSAKMLNGGKNKYSATHNTSCFGIHKYITGGKAFKRHEKFVELRTAAKTK